MGSECRCPRCELVPAREYTPEFLLACLGRHILNMPSGLRFSFVAELEGKGRGWVVDAALKAAANDSNGVRGGG